MTYRPNETRARFLACNWARLGLPHPRAGIGSSKGKGLASNGIVASALAVALTFIAGIANPVLANKVANGDFEFGNAGFSSDYDFVESCGEFGAFMIAQSPAAVCPGNWVDFGDHSTGTGLMMIVDGARDTDKVVWSETVKVNPDTDYVFIYWAASADPEVDGLGPASIQAMINGKSVGKPLELKAYIGWRRRLVRWSSGSNTSAIIALKDLKSRRSGNDFALDDLRFRADPRHTIR